MWGTCRCKSSNGESRDRRFFTRRYNTKYTKKQTPFGAFLDETGLVDDADGMFTGMFFGNDFVKFVSHLLVIPLLLGEEPLDGSRWDFGLEGDGFAIFAGEGRNESSEIESEIVSGILVGEAGFEASEQLVQIGTNFGGIG